MVTSYLKALIKGMLLLVAIKTHGRSTQKYGGWVSASVNFLD
ncbi:Uncharacterised protein [Vibrio cholerae]|nr:Uncharacterised protein [Vibrio cholerae]